MEWGRATSIRHAYGHSYAYTFKLLQVRNRSANRVCKKKATIFKVLVLKGLEIVLLTSICSFGDEVTKFDLKPSEQVRTII